MTFIISLFNFQFVCRINLEKEDRYINFPSHTFFKLLFSAALLMLSALRVIAYRGFHCIYNKDIKIFTTVKRLRDSVVHEFHPIWVYIDRIINTVSVKLGMMIFCW